MLLQKATHDFVLAHMRQQRLTHSKRAVDILAVESFAHIIHDYIVKVQEENIAFNLAERCYVCYDKITIEIRWNK